MLSRNICFKSYIMGGYFGEIEVFRRSLRLFNIRAECSTELICIEAGKFESIMAQYPEVILRLKRKAMRRYLAYKVAMKKIEMYRDITMNDDFWSPKRPLEDTINNKILRWLDKIENYRFYERKLSGNFNGPQSCNNSLKSFVMQRSLSKKRKEGSIRQMRKQFRKDTTSEQIVNYLRQTKESQSGETVEKSTFLIPQRRSIINTNGRHSRFFTSPAEDLEDERVTDLFNIVRNVSQMADQIEEVLEENKQTLQHLREKVDNFTERFEKKSVGCSSCHETRAELEEILRYPEDYPTRNSIIEKITSILSNSSSNQKNEREEKSQQLYPPIIQTFAHPKQLQSGLLKPECQRAFNNRLDKPDHNRSRKVSRTDSFIMRGVEELRLMPIILTPCDNKQRTRKKRKRTVIKKFNNPDCSRSMSLKEENSDMSDENDKSSNESVEDESSLEDKMVSPGLYEKRIRNKKSPESRMRNEPRKSRREASEPFLPIKSEISLPKYHTKEDDSENSGIVFTRTFKINSTTKKDVKNDVITNDIPPLLSRIRTSKDNSPVQQNLPSDLNIKPMITSTQPEKNRRIKFNTLFDGNQLAADSHRMATEQSVEPLLSPAGLPLISPVAQANQEKEHSNAVIKTEFSRVTTNNALSVKEQLGSHFGGKVMIKRKIGS